MLTLRGATFRYRGALADSLRDVSLELPSGSLTTLLGAGAAGLSTLCLVLGGLAPRVVSGSLRGALLVDGRDVRDMPMHELCGTIATATGRPAGQLSMVAETVLEEVAFGPANLGLPHDDVLVRAHAALEALAIGELAGHDPARLSGGQQQLVALAGLLAMRPRHLVLDEPLAHLDGAGRARLRTAVAGAAAGGATVLLASHDADETATEADRLALLVDGRVARQGRAAELLDDPATWELGVAEPAERRLARLLAPRDPMREPAPTLASPVAEPPPPSLPPLPLPLPPLPLPLPPAAAAPIDIALEAVHFAYPGGPPVLDGLDLALPGGQSVAIVGANGSGKTTLARHLVGLLRPDRGRVLVDGRDVAAVRVAQLARSVAVGFQDPDRGIFARTVRDEVAFGPRQLGLDAGRREAVVMAALAAVGLGDAAERHPYDLGEGPRKLLALASLLAMATPVVVLDEPTAGLDAAGVQHVQAIVRALLEQGRTVIVISQDLRFVAETVARVIVLDGGRVALDGTPEEAFGEAAWPVLADADLEPPVAARLGARLGLGATPTEAALLAAAAARRR